MLEKWNITKPLVACIYTLSSITWFFNINKNEFSRIFTNAIIWLSSFSHIFQTMRNFFLTLIIFLSSPVVGYSATLNETYHYYPVSLANISTMLDDINNASPIRHDGRVFHGYTKTSLTWSFFWRNNESLCTISEVSTQVDALYTLPKMVDGLADDHVTEIWQRWYPALVEHEKGHTQLAVRMADELRKGLENLPGFQQCENLEKKANAIGYKFIDKLKHLDKEYDIETQHGATEGASLLSYL